MANGDGTETGTGEAAPGGAEGTRAAGALGEPSATGAEGTGEAEGAAAAEAARQTVPIERFRAVIGQRAEREAQLQQARRELELANETIAQFRALSEGAASAAGEAGSASGAPKPAAVSSRAPTPAELEALVSQEAARRDFTRQCNEAFASGKAAHSDFEKVIADLNALSPVFDPRAQRSVMPQSLVEAALATGQAHEVLYALGKDNALADRVFSMTPLQQAAALTRLADKLASEGTASEQAAAQAAAASSKAPPPVKPKVTGSGSVAPAWDPSATDKFSTEEWIRNRERDIARAREATKH